MKFFKMNLRVASHMSHNCCDKLCIESSEAGVVATLVSVGMKNKMPKISELFLQAATYTVRVLNPAILDFCNSWQSQHADL